MGDDCTINLTGFLESAQLHVKSATTMLFMTSASLTGGISYVLIYLLIQYLLIFPDLPLAT